MGALLALDPDLPLAVGLVIAALAVCAGASVSALLLSLPAAGRRRRAAAPALRRGIEVTGIVGLLLLLRVVDGLTPVTAGFVVLGILVAEFILSARPTRSSR